MQIQEIDHICFAVRSLETARRIYEDILGLKPASEYVSEEESIRVVGYYVGTVMVELIEPTTPTCEVARFLENKGEGFFLISYRVDDVDATLADLRQRGLETIDDKPRQLLGNKYAFIQPPKDMHGVLIEIVEGEFKNLRSPAK